MDDDMQQDGSMEKKTEADDVKQNVKEKVAKGVAAVAGALKGFSEEANKTDLAGSTKQAIQKAGETTRELASAAKSEFRETRDSFKGSGSPSIASASAQDKEDDDADASTTLNDSH